MVHAHLMIYKFCNIFRVYFNTVVYHCTWNLFSWSIKQFKMSYYLFHTSTVKLIPFCLYIISAIKQWENKVMKFYHATSSLKHPTDLISIKHNYYLNDRVMYNKTDHVCEYNLPCRAELSFLNFIYFTTITKQVIQLILIMLVGTDVCVRMVFVWEETGVPGETPPVWLGYHMTISHADAGYWTRVAAMRGECVNTAAARQPEWVVVLCSLSQSLLMFQT